MQNSEPPTASVTPTMLAMLLSLTIVVAYFAFILLVALAKPLLATIVTPGQPWIDFRRRPLGVLHVGQFHFCSHAKS
jgi:uncharacterized membrane protein (DUF485 family)